MRPHCALFLCINDGGLVKRFKRKGKKKRRQSSGAIKAPGSPPGLLTVAADALEPKITIFAYGPDVCEEHHDVGLADIEEELEHPVVWINVDGFGDIELLRKLGERFQLHPLALEDVVSVHQRAKVEDFPEHLFVIARMPVPTDPLQSEQFSFFVRKKVILTFQERPGDLFAPVRERLRLGRGKLRHRGPDYLAYALLDAIIDHHFPIVESFADRLDRLEEVTVSSGGKYSIITQLYEMKHELQVLRQTLKPLRETLATLQRDVSLPFIHDDTRPFLRDCLDHALRIEETIESFKDGALSLQNLYLALQGQQLNEITKVLTIIATVFIPLSFIAGLYGMNFTHMPELKWDNGYYYALGIMAAVATTMLVFFRIRGWLGPPKDKD